MRMRGVDRKTGRKRAFGRPRHSWSDNIKIDLKQVWENVEWIHLADNRDI